MLCNGLDRIFSKWISKHAQYDYSEVDNRFFPEYVKKYYNAHNKYIDAQKKENLGSDRKNKIIEEYYNVVLAYKDVYEMHVQPRAKKIETTARNKKMAVWVSTGFILFNIAIEILSKFIL